MGPARARLPPARHFSDFKIFSGLTRICNLTRSSRHGAVGSLITHSCIVYEYVPVPSVLYRNCSLHVPYTVQLLYPVTLHTTAVGSARLWFDVDTHHQTGGESWGVRRGGRHGKGDCQIRRNHRYQMSVTQMLDPNQKLASE